MANSQVPIELSQSQSENNNRKSMTVSIEGNIGAGKTTVLSKFSQYSWCDIKKEPVEDWKNMNGYNLLDMYYKDPKRWGFPFQCSSQMLFAKLHAEPSKAPVKIMERSIYGTRYPFNEILYRDGILHDVEYKILDDSFKMLIANGSCNLDYIVYLRCSPETCLERIRQRNRSEEVSMDPNYLVRLHERLEEWLLPNSDNIMKESFLTVTPQSIPLLVIDANRNTEQVLADIYAFVDNLTKC